MKQLLTILALILSTAGSAHAATVVNKDAQTQVLIVTEGGSKMEIAVEAGARAEICPAGCFVTMPNGDRETLSGSETIEIINGSAVIK